MAVFVGPPGAGTAVVSVALPVCIIAIVFLRVGRTLGAAVPSDAAVREARDARRLGRARIDRVTQTGPQINEQPLCDVDVTVRPLTGEAYATTLRMIVPLTELPIYQAGAERDVALLIEGGPEAVFVDGELSPAEHDALTVPPRSNVPFRAVPPHTRIDGGRRRGPLLGIGRRGRPWRLALFTVIALVAGAAVLLPYREAVALTAAAIHEGRWSVDLRRPEALAQAERSLQTAIGHDRVVSITVSTDFVLVDAPVRAGEIATDEWIYRGGQVSRQGAARPQPELAAEQFAWTDVALDRLWPAMQEAAARSGLPLDGAAAFVQRATDDDVTSDTFIRNVGAPTMGFTLRDDYRSQSFRLTADGNGPTPVG